MIIATHAIFTAYGFWLPNDPRGSWSTWIRRWELLRFGEIVPAGTRASVAWREHDVARRVAAKQALMYPEVHFTGIQGRAVARGFQRAVEEGGYTILACAILPEHVHMVIRRHGRYAQRIVGHLKAAANARLVEESIHLFQEVHQPGGDRVSPWTRRAWKVFLDTPGDVKRAVRYVEENPLKEGYRAQAWGFVTPVSAEADR